jgi:hypothetical protein
MTGIYKLADVKDYLKNKLLGRDEWAKINQNRIDKCYNLISNPFNRVNDDDKRYVAYVTQASENITVIDEIEEILNENGYTRTREDIIEIVDDVGELFQAKGLDLKERIPFYVLTIGLLI